MGFELQDLWSLTAPLTLTLLSLSHQQQWLLGLVISVILVAAHLLYTYYVAPSRLPFKNLPGPEPSGNFLYRFFIGDVEGQTKGVPGAWHTNNFDQYGHTFRSRFMAGGHYISTYDPKAIAHIYKHPEVWEKPAFMSTMIGHLVGKGLVAADRHEYIRQRRVMSRAFGAEGINRMTPIVFDIANELADKIGEMLDNGANNARDLNMHPLTVAYTLDVIGRVGFDYNFGAIQNGQDSDALAGAFKDLAEGMEGSDPWFALQCAVPALDKLPGKMMRLCRETAAIARPIGMRLIERKKAEVEAFNSGLSKGDNIGKDLLSLLIQSNLAADLRPEQRLTDEEVVAQLTTMMFAGNESTATSLSWMLYTLSRNPAIQDKLRAELLTLPTSTPDAVQLNSLPYLEAFVRESLRVNPPTNGQWEAACEDTMLPLAKPVRGRDGKMMDSIAVTKGTVVVIQPRAVNCSPDLWGPDATVFNPDRFMTSDGEESAKVCGAGPSIPTTWHNITTFFGGPRICLGFRLAVLELKAALFVLLRSFEFSEIPGVDIKEKMVLVMVPEVEGMGLQQMPLHVRRLD